ncbi:MAG: 16S rRNA (guanine(527)-N(7))-methyltransferase RsmG [Candidatus Cloacimonadota bacterium]
MENKEFFRSYLEQLSPEHSAEIMLQFERYLELLQEINASINLISRKMPPEAYWTQHFLDSLRPLECLDIKGLRLLDFGSGGGLPGIPLKLVEPDLQIDLLDSTAKKVKALQQMVQVLGLNGVDCLTHRLEDYANLKAAPQYDVIVCRAVAIEERYLQPLWKLLKPGGFLLLYKSHNLEDIKDLNHELLLEHDEPELGLRRIIRIKRGALKAPAPQQAKKS